MKSKLLFVVMVLLFDGGGGGDDNDNHIGGDDSVMKRDWKPIKNGLPLPKAKNWTLDFDGVELWFFNSLFLLY